MTVYAGFDELCMEWYEVNISRHDDDYVSRNAKILENLDIFPVFGQHGDYFRWSVDDYLVMADIGVSLIFSLET